MVINIGGLWDGPISVDDERLLVPSYSDLLLSESEIISEPHEEYTATDSIHFKSFSPDQAEGNIEHNWLGYSDPRPEIKEEIFPKELSKNISAISVRKQDAFSHRVSMDSEAAKSESICPHACKALRVRSHGTKDRHSKVSTPKGIRDTRVRLSIPTAIQFYEVQHRLGFDHSSQVLDWLMSKARVAIDKLPQPSHISLKKCALCKSLGTDHAISAHSQTKPKPMYAPADLSWKSLRNGEEKNPVSMIQNAPQTNKWVALPNDISVFYSRNPSGVEWLTPKSEQSIQPWWFQQGK
ncbi:hypothetical protein SUGI_0842070 [Cryptomeria japonica]|nr:hypothetical protein SUGI_0842070 [Cryptomeria japonica]